jgi:1,2-diacylglycerol 3-alpha-glucosyltransferase
MALPFGQAQREALSWKPDVVHVHTPFIIGKQGVHTARKLGVPLVGTHHTFFDHYLKHLYIDSEFTRDLSWKYLVKHYNQYDLVLSPSRALLEGMKSRGLEKETRFFPNSIPTDFFVPADRDEKARIRKELGINGPCLTYMGRLSYEKSIDKVIEAFALLKKQIPESLLMVIGDGPEKQKLEDLVEKLGLDKSVIFTGLLFETNLLEAFQASDVFITASKSENMPLSVIEAMSVGLPVVGVDALGIPEIVKDSQNGFIVSPDNIQAMAEKVVELFTNKELYTEYSRRSRELALQYGEVEHARALETIYTFLLSRE